MIKIGDKVRFLNALGEGVVVGIQSKEVVLVRDADDFDVPTHVRDLVVVQETNQYNFPTEKSTPREEVFEENTPEIPEETYAFDERNETAEGEQLSVYLAFVPTDFKQIQRSNYDAFLVNDSNYYHCCPVKVEKKVFEIIENQSVI